MDINVSRLLAVAKEKGYRIYDDNDYALNIWGIRSNDECTKKFNDYICIFRKCSKPSVPSVNLKDWKRRYQDGWCIDIFTATTDPSDKYLKNPLNKNGTAIVVPGQYTNVYEKGFHNGRANHPCLKQVRSIKVYRDNTRDFKLDFCGKIEEGLFGINCHRAGNILSELIGLHSAGCQVVKATNHFNSVFLWLIDKSIENNIKSFTYTLITENEYYL